MLLTDTEANKHHHNILFTDLTNSFKNTFNEYDTIIEKDLIRTPSCNNNKLHKQKLQNVLRALVRKNSEKGYLQGFNFIADYFLLNGFNQEETFWIMSYILEKLLHPQFYIEFFPLFSDIKFLKVIIFHLNTDLFNHLTSLKIDFFFLLHKWFLLHFLEDSNCEVMKWFLDFFLLEGERATIKTSLFIFLKGANRIMNKKTIHEIKFCIENIKREITDEMDFLKNYKKIFLSEYLYKNIRKILIKKEKSNILTIS